MKNLEINEHLISESYRDENGMLIRDVDGKKITQIEEKTKRDALINRAINLNRMRRR